MFAHNRESYWANRELGLSRLRLPVRANFVVSYVCRRGRDAERLRRLQVDNQLILVACYTGSRQAFRLSRCGPCRRRQGGSLRQSRRRGQRSQRSARGVARAASQIDLQLLELGDVLIDALLPILAQRFPDLRR